VLWHPANGDTDVRTDGHTGNRAAESATAYPYNPHFNVFVQDFAVCLQFLQFFAVVLQLFAKVCNTSCKKLQKTAKNCKKLQTTAKNCKKLQNVAKVGDRRFLTEIDGN
jgi:Na+-transporting methylmalonyl-CoA/oxaloacetate decarboxylase gamma subunit